MSPQSALYNWGDASEVDPHIQALRLASGHLAAQAVYAFTALGCADALAYAPKTAEQVAESVGANPDALYRLLRFLSTVGVVLEDSEKSFTLTPVGNAFRSRAMQAVRDNTLLMCSEPYWQGIGRLLHNVKTGRTGFKNYFAEDFFDWLGKNPEHSGVFNAAMDSSSGIGISAIVAGYDFAGCRHVVDIAGGKGALLKGVLRKYPGIRGTLFDSSAVLSQLKPDPDFSGRLAMIAGNFFEQIPAGADAYILRRILHDWNDEKAVEILRNCRKAMGRESRLLVIEISEPQDAGSRNNYAGLDLIMMVLMDGRERTARELEELLGKADFRVNRILKTSSPYSIVEALPS